MLGDLITRFETDFWPRIECSVLVAQCKYISYCDLMVLVVLYSFGVDAKVSSPSRSEVSSDKSDERVRKSNHTNITCKALYARA
jgi:hypothetical protein